MQNSVRAESQNSDMPTHLVVAVTIIVTIITDFTQGDHKVREKIPEFSRLFRGQKLYFSIGYRN